MYVPEGICAWKQGSDGVLGMICATCHRTLIACLLCVLRNAKQWQPDACVLEPKEAGSSEYTRYHRRSVHVWLLGGSM